MLGTCDDKASQVKILGWPNERAGDELNNGIETWNDQASQVEKRDNLENEI